MNELQLKMCDIQGRLFELATENKYASKEFIKAFMNSEIAKNIDSSFNHMQWAGEEYLFDELIENNKDIVNAGGKIYKKEVMFWIGFIYRYWNYYSGENSPKIYKIADAMLMEKNYLMFHSFDPAMAIDNLREIYEQKH